MKYDIKFVGCKTIIETTLKGGYCVCHYNWGGRCDMESGEILKGCRRNGTLELLIANKNSEGDPCKWIFITEPYYRLGQTDYRCFKAQFEVECNSSRIN